MPANSQSNGPYTWGNGPKKYGIIKRIALALKERQARKQGSK